MSWTGTNPVSVGDPTKKKNYDTLWDNVQHIKTNVMSSGTVMLFGQNSPPTGWTRKTGWTHNSMIIYSSGDVASGGSANPASEHSHGVGTYAVLAHNHKWMTNPAGDWTTALTYNAAGTAVPIPYATGQKLSTQSLIAFYNRGSDGAVPKQTALSTAYTNNASPALGSGESAKNTAPLYQSVIAATKDAY